MSCRVIPCNPAYLEREQAPSTAIPPIDWVAYPEGVDWIGHEEGRFLALIMKNPMTQTVFSCISVCFTLVTMENI